MAEKKRAAKDVDPLVEPPVPIPDGAPRSPNPKAPPPGENVDFADYGGALDRDSALVNKQVAEKMIERETNPGTRSRLAYNCSGAQKYATGVYRYGTQGEVRIHVTKVSPSGVSEVGTWRIQDMREYGTLVDTLKDRYWDGTPCNFDWEMLLGPNRIVGDVIRCESDPVRQAQFQKRLSDYQDMGRQPLPAAAPAAVVPPPLVAPATPALLPLSTPSAPYGQNPFGYVPPSPFGPSAPYPSSPQPAAAPQVPQPPAQQQPPYPQYPQQPPPSAMPPEIARELSETRQLVAKLLAESEARAAIERDREARAAREAHHREPQPPPYALGYGVPYPGGFGGGPGFGGGYGPYFPPPAPQVEVRPVPRQEAPPAAPQGPPPNPSQLLFQPINEAFAIVESVKKAAGHAGMVERTELDKVRAEAVEVAKIDPKVVTDENGMRFVDVGNGYKFPYDPNTPELFDWKKFAAANTPKIVEGVSTILDKVNTMIKTRADAVKTAAEVDAQVQASQQRAQVNVPPSYAPAPQRQPLPPQQTFPPPQQARPQPAPVRAPPPPPPPPAQAAPPAQASPSFGASGVIGDPSLFADRQAPAAKVESPGDPAGSDEPFDLGPGIFG